jgi:DNA invertase Pin-like site-specific DNA recombinase
MRTRTRPDPTPAVPVEPALAYVTAPEDRRSITEACPELGLELAGTVHEPGGDRSRPVLARALDEIAQGRATCLVVSRLEDLTHGEGGLAPVLDRVDALRLRLVALDVGLDTAADTGRLALARHALAGQPPIVEETPVVEETPAAVEETPVVEETPAAVIEVGVVAIGYACASGPKHGAAEELAGQRAAIEARCAEAGVQLAELVGDRELKDGKALDRPGLSHALQRIAAGEASCLIVGELARLSHSVAELGQLVRWLDRNRIRLIAVDLGLDTATDAGRTTARALASVADWERERLSERTRAGLAAARAKRHSPTGAHADEAAMLHRRIAAMRAEGMTLQAIADVLNDEGVPTQRGGTKWRPSSVQSAAGYKRPARARTADRLPEPRQQPGELG